MSKLRTLLDGVYFILVLPIVVFLWLIAEGLLMIKGGMIIMKKEGGAKIDAVLDALSDGQWHSLDEILEKANLELTKEKLMKILDFLCVYNLLEIDAIFGKAKLKPAVVKFLSLE